MTKIKKFILLFFQSCITCLFLMGCNEVNAAPQPDVAGLELCRQSSSFSKRYSASLKKLETRLQKYEPSSPPALALEQQIQRTHKRFYRYAKSDLLCGKDGLPHLIADGRWNHSREFILPAIMFLYITGWIGWVGRKYVGAISKTSNPTEKEIIIDVPLALNIASTGFIWPLSAWQEFISGKLLASDSEITVSPR